MVAFSAAAAVRAPAVAGAFYPGTEDGLRAAVTNMLREAPPNEASSTVNALVVPHAGYLYSGATAARAFRTLEGADVRRIILIGPSHRASFSGGALPRRGVTAFGTPLGEAAVDVGVVEELRKSRLFDGPGSAHDGEHCLEVELPFLQIVAPEAGIVPILIGHHTGREQIEEMGRELSPFLTPGTVVVVSTDFSHHGRAYGWAPFPVGPDLGERLVGLGKATADLVADGEGDGFWHQVETSGDTVCGRHPVSLLLALVERAFQGRGEVLGVTTSGHVLGDFNQSVTYASVAFFGKWEPWREAGASPSLGTLSRDDRLMVVELARAVLKTHLGHGPELARWFKAFGERSVLQSPAGAFVTLNHAGVPPGKPGRLRACMGVMDARQSLVEAVIQAGISAAHDPRFRALEQSELEDLDLEVSVLSPRSEVAGPEAIEVGVHGVVLSKKGRSAVFLPQVAVEQGWDRATMLSHLARKAGLAPDAWEKGARFEVFTAQIAESH